MLSACYEMLNADWTQRTFCLFALTLTLMLMLRGDFLRRTAVPTVAAYTPRRLRNKAAPMQRRKSTNVTSPHQYHGISNSLMRVRGTNGGIRDEQLELQDAEAASAAAAAAAAAGVRWVDR